MHLFYFARRKVTQCMPLRYLKMYCVDVTIVISGVLRYEIDGIPVELHAGDAYVFPKGACRTREGGTAAEYYSFNFQTDPGETLPPLAGLLRGCVTEEIRDLLRLYENCVESHSACMKEKSIHYFMALYMTLREFSLEGGDKSHVSRIRRYIDANLYRHVSLAEIAGAVFLSPNYCNTIFKKQTGQTISDYILKARMEEAKRLLLQSTAPLTEIAASLGYTEYGYFSRSFRRVHGITPTQFRKIYVYEIGPR